MSQIIKLLKCLEQTSQIDAIKQELHLDNNQLSVLVRQINQINYNQISLEKDIITLNGKINWLSLDKLKLDDYVIKILLEVDSTNNYLLQNLANFSNKTIVTAEMQTKGRGRSDNTWRSQIAKDITMSILYNFVLDYNFGLLPIIIAVAISRVLKNYYNQVKIKWPNDIFADTEKIAGVLIESKIIASKRYIVVGIGINNLRFERNKLLVDVVHNIDNVLAESNLLGFALLRREWLDNCIHLGRQVNIYQDKNLIDSGIHTDLSNSGEIIIKTDDGLKSYYPTNISLRY